MNIAIFTDSFVPLLNGVVTATINLAKGLADEGHQVIIIAPKYKNLKEFSHPNITVKRISSVSAFYYPGFRFTSPVCSSSLIKYLKLKKIDIIHLQTPITLGMQAIFAAKILKKPLVGTFHTFITDSQYLKHLGRSANLLEKASWVYVKKYYDKCDLITCPSQSAKDELTNHGFIKPIKVISNGMDLSLFASVEHKKKNKVNSKILIKKHSINNKAVLFVGRMAYEKNINYLLDCFKYVVDEIADSKLILVGDGPQINELKNQVIQLGMNDNVIFTGKINHKDLLESGIFNSCKVFATASITENQPMTILEAQANGLPCIGLNVKGIKDLIKNNENGYLVKQGDKKGFAKKIISVLNDRKLQAVLSKNSLREIKKHDLKLIIKDWVSTYSSEINRK